MQVIIKPDTEKRNRTYFKKKIAEEQKSLKEIKSNGDGLEFLDLHKFMLSHYRSELRRLIKSGKRELPLPEPEPEDEEIQWNDF